jgi:polar amino acid transport system permease protein
MFNTALFLEALPAITQAAGVTVRLTLASCLVSLAVGIALAALQLSSFRLGYALSRAYVSLMRGTPLFVQLLVVSFGLPLVGIRGQAFLAAALAIGLNSGAYVTEILRAAIIAVPEGQTEAADTVGMSRRASFMRIVLPQAIITSLPALTLELTIVLKSTPLASVVAVTEMTYTGVLIQSRVYSAIEVFVPIAAIYVGIAVALARLSRNLERRFGSLRPV